MSRRAARLGNSAAVSLFPFLAVLICTMGALIVLLVIVVQQARVEAADVAEGTPAAPVGPARDPVADAQHLVEMLELRDLAIDQLEELRLSLAELEDHTRVLEDEFAHLEAQNQRLENGQTDGNDVARLEQERQWLEREIEETRAEHQQALRELARKARSYAIIPYEGPQGTRRRPIYIECCADRVIIQPEGIELYRSDFQPPLGPGNPLAAALRSIREYWAEQGQLGNGGEPYPLLLVRPDGAITYSAAREAMKSWDDQFGYELIEGDMVVAFPPADPRLDVIVQRSLADARARQEYLVQAAPNRYGRGGGDIGGWGGSEAQGGFGPGGSGAAGGGSGYGEAVGSGPGSSGQPGGDLSWSTGGQPGTGEAAGTGQSEYAPSGGSGAQPGEGLAGGTGASPYGGTEVEPGAPVASGSPTGAAAGERVAEGGESGAGGSVGVGGNIAASGAGSAASGGSASGQGGSSPLANSRGNNWGLPRNDGTTIGYARPIRVGLDGNALTIHRETDDVLQPLVVPLERGRVSGSIDQFVAAVWTYMEDWGHAGPGSYWKPVLNVEVAPGAEESYSELAYLLQGSGIEVIRK